MAKKGTSNVPMIMGIIGGVLGIPAAYCSGACAACLGAVSDVSRGTTNQATEFGSFYLWMGLIGAAVGLIGGLLGKKLEIIAYDYSKEPATEAVTATNRFIQQDKVVAIIGPSGSNPAIPMIPIVNEAKVPVIATSATNPKVTVNEDTGEAYDYMFRVCFIDPYQGRVLADFAYSDAGFRKVAVLKAIGDPYAESMTDTFVERFTELGGEIVTQMGYQENDVEFRAQLSEAGKYKAEALFAPATAYRDAGLMAKQAKDLGLNFTFLFGDGIYAQELLDIAGNELEGAYMTAGVTEDDPILEEFKKDFAEKHSGQSANIYVAYTLDAMMLLEDAIKRAGSFDTEKIKDELENTKDVQLFTDKFTMESDTHNPHNKAVSILQISQGKFNLLRSYKPED